MTYTYLINNSLTVVSMAQEGEERSRQVYNEEPVCHAGRDNSLPLLFSSLLPFALSFSLPHMGGRSIHFTSLSISKGNKSTQLTFIHCQCLCLEHLSLSSDLLSSFSSFYCFSSLPKAQKISSSGMMLPPCPQVKNENILSLSQLLARTHIADCSCLH